jgi:hypothetical protein
MMVCAQAALRGAEDEADAAAALAAEREQAEEMDEFTKVSIPCTVHCVHRQW